MLEASAFQALQAEAPYRGRIKPPVELVVRDWEFLGGKYRIRNDEEKNWSLYI